MDSSLGVAIVGIAAELPSGKHSKSNLDFSSYWQFLLDGLEAYETIPENHFNVEGRIGHGPGQIITSTGAFLKDADMFDHVEFGISAKDAAGLSLGTRRLIELSFLALLDSGIDSRSGNVGCYAAAVNHGFRALSDVDEYETLAPFTETPYMVANRISYHLDLRGPSFPVDTACSSSLTALHLAAQAIVAGDCDAAIVAGCQTNYRYSDWVDYSHGGILAPDGKCKPFDVSANGFVRGEGAVSIVLKDVKAALRDGDRIYATILGSAINSTGQQAPLYAPVGRSQEIAMETAFRRAGRRPQDVDYMELHATGTAAGDPIEANWVGARFRKSDGGQLVCGSVKGNIGHLEITAFLASLLKVVHVVNNRLVPPNVNLTTLNPRIAWDPQSFRIPTTSPLALDAQKPQLLSCLSSSGIGGANGHVVVAGPPETTASSPPHTNGRTLLFAVGGLTPRSATAAANELRTFLDGQPASLWPAISTALGRRARQLTWRTAATAVAGDATGLRFKEPALSVRRPLVFVFSGQGPQHIDMGRELFAAYPAFRESVLGMDDIYKEKTGKSLVADFGLFGATRAEESALGDWAVSLPALAIVQMATYDLLHALGLRPDAILGHSAGETAVVYASGAGDKALAIEVALARGKFMKNAEELDGGMAAVSCGPDEARRLIADTVAELEGTVLELVCYNAPNAVAISGTLGAVERLCARAESQGIWARKIRIPVPVHSSLLDPIQDDTRQFFRDVFKERTDVVPKVCTLSSVTGDVFDGAFDADYFWSNARQPVQFVRTIESATRLLPNAVFVEISPHPVLAAYITSIAPPATRVVTVLRRPAKGQASAEQAALVTGLGQLTEAGFNVDFRALNGVQSAPPDLPLPSYPFTKKPVPFHAQDPSYYRKMEPLKMPLNRPLLRISAQTHPLLGQHVVHGIPIMPGAGFIEMGLEYGARTLHDVEFLMALSLASEPPEHVQMTLDGAEWTIRTSSSPANTSSHAPKFDRLHARGLLLKVDERVDQHSSKALNVDDIRARCLTTRKVDDLYDLGFKGYADYGPEFRRIKTCISGEDELLISLRGSDGSKQFEEYVFSPAVMDSVFQACMFFDLDRNEKILDYETRDFYLPARVAAVEIHDHYVRSGMPADLLAHLSLTSWTPHEITVNISISDVTGIVLCTLAEFTMRKHAVSAAPTVDNRFTVQWQRSDIKSITPSVSPRTCTRDNTGAFAALDLVAQAAARDTIQGSPEVGDELDRARYMAFLQRLAAADLVPSEVPAETFPSHLELTQKVTESHKEILKSSHAAVQALFGDPKTMLDFYSSSNPFAGACQDAARIFTAVINDLAHQGKQVIQVLEVGCGTGMLTEYLCRALDDVPSVQVEYTASDLSLELARQAAKRTSCSAVHPRRLNLAADLSEQGMAPSSLDVVTALHVLHAVPDLSKSLASLLDLLVPGGVLVCVDFDGSAWEAARPGTYWYDFVFGSFAEWFGFQDGRSHCSVNQEGWRKLLTDLGCSHVQFMPSPIEEDSSMVIVAQKASLSANGTTTLQSASSEPHELIFEYSRGREPELRQLIRDRDISEPTTLLIVCANPVDAGIAQGLSRTLRRELPVWQVRLVILDESYTALQREGAIRHLRSLRSAEPEIRVDARGGISVPRVVDIAEPGDSYAAFSAAEPWISTGTTMTLVHAGVPSGDQVTVEVDRWSSLSPPSSTVIKCFVGRVVDAGSTERETGSVVAGITTSPLSNVLVVDSRVLCTLSEKDAEWTAGELLSLAAATMALPTSAAMSASYRSSIAILVLDADLPVGASLHHSYLCLGITATPVSSKDLTPSRLSPLLKTTQVIVGSAATFSAHPWLSRLQGAAGKLFAWDGLERGIPQALLNDPAAVGSALSWALQHAEKRQAPGDAQLLEVTTESITRPWLGKLVSDRRTLFDPRKVYLLIGGTGGLGVHLAWWMYRKGARNLVLTSRSGLAAILRNTANRRMFAHLQTLPDLRLAVEAVDATDRAGMQAVVAKQTRALGGCMLLTLQLVDKLFVNQTDDDFERVVANKLDTWKTLEAILDLSALDFVIGFSSISGVGGIAGQSNYTSACTAMEHQVAQRRNAFALVVPAITDCGWLARDQTSAQSESLLQWGIKSEALFAGLEDGLRILAKRPLSLYIPAIDWRRAATDIGRAPMFAHLAAQAAPVAGADAQEDGGGASLEALVLSVLDVDPKDFSPRVPMVNYGLDSLVAVRLVAMVKAHTGTTVTQIQLLANMTFEQLDVSYPVFLLVNGICV